MSGNGNELLARFRDYLVHSGWMGSGESTLLAVSGGLDSVVMVDLFQRAGLSFGVAHCNFRLRGAASDADAALVRDLAKACGTPYFETSFPAETLARERKLSIQVIARELRYEWLERMRSNHGYAWIATAHHLNDSIETALFNWVRGTGLRGLLGIPRQNGRVIRPLMFATRPELDKYMEERALVYRTDASNLEDKYSRNKIRHHIWPVLKKINPYLEDTFRDNLERLEQINAIYEWALDKLRGEWTEERDGHLHISIPPLRTFTGARTLLFEWLRAYGFSSRQVGQVFEALGGDPGAVFYSPTYRILLDRDQLVVAPLAAEEAPTHVHIRRADQTLELPEGYIEVRLLSGRPDTFPDSDLEVCLDADRLVFPLCLRRWRGGDQFAPLGLGGHHQKLQDFFSNQKLSRFEKERIWLLVDADGEIAWVVGRRIAETFKITTGTKNYLRVRYHKS